MSLSCRKTRQLFFGKDRLTVGNFDRSDVFDREEFEFRAETVYNNLIVKI